MLKQTKRQKNKLGILQTVPFYQMNAIKQCAKDQGGSGCVKEKSNGSWGVISNRTDKFWPANYKDEKTS